MKNKLICFALLITFFGFGCKKDIAIDDVTSYNWVLKTQVISPAITVNGKTSTNNVSLQNPEGCTKNFTYTFHETGLYTVSSNGALCDMFNNHDAQIWKLEGNQLILEHGNAVTYGSSIIQLSMNKNMLIHTTSLTSGGINHTITSTYIAQKK